MPLFEFHCDRCGIDFDELVSRDKIVSVECPKCGGSDVERKLSVFSARSTAAQAAPSSGSACGRCGDPDGPCSM